MATHDYIISNASGASVRADLNNALAAIVSNNSNATSPATTYAYQWWADTTTGQLKLRNSANSAWITIFELDGTMLMEDGSLAAPGLAFASDLDTGFSRSAANKINFSTGGAERLEIGSSEVVFNDPSNDVDFRVESNGNSHMLFVDAGNDRVGIGASAPDSTLEIAAGPPSLKLTRNTAASTGNDFGRIIFENSAGTEVSRIDSLSESGNTTPALKFSNNGSEKFRVDSSGRLLVGTTSDVSGGLSTTLIQGVATGGGYVGLARNDTSVADGNGIGGLRFYANDPSGYNDVGIVQCVADGDHAADDYPTRLEFHTTADGASSPTERVRIDSSGQLLVGTTTAFGGNSEMLQIARNGGGAIALLRNDTSVSSGNELGAISWYGNDSTSSTYQECATIRAFADGAHADDDKPTRLVFSTTADGASSPTERLKIDSNGRVGIGVTPSEILDVIQSAQGDAATLRIRNSADSDASTNVEIVARQATRTGGRIVFGRENANSWNSAAGYASGFISFNPTDAGTDTEHARLTSSGQLLVGTTSALISDSEKKLQMVHASAGAGIVVGRNDTSVSAGNLLGGIEFVGNDSNGTYQKCAKIEAIADGTHGDNDKPTRLGFSVTADNGSSPTERMRINQNGVFNHFTDDHFTIRTVRTGSGPGIISMRNGATSITDGTQVFSVRADGDCENTNNSYGALSDIKLKENIIDASSQWDDLKAIQVRKYNFKEETKYGTHTQLGVVAQEVELISPGLVSETPDFDEEGNDLGTTTKSVNYSVLYMKAVKALQEAMDRIETLETKVAALEAG